MRLPVVNFGLTIGLVWGLSYGVVSSHMNADPRGPTSEDRAPYSTWAVIVLHQEPPAHNRIYPPSDLLLLVSLFPGINGNAQRLASPYLEVETLAEGGRHDGKMRFIGDA